MARRIRSILIAATLAAVFVMLAAWLSFEGQATREAVLKKNLNRAGLAGEIDLTAAPLVKFSQDTVNIGCLNPFDKVSQSIVVHKQGQRALKLTVSNRPCDCIAARISDEKLTRGEKGVVGIDFTAPEQEGLFRHTLLIATNDPRQREVSLTIEGEVRRTVWTEPNVIAFAQLTPQEVKAQEIRVFANWAEGLELAHIKGLPPGITISDTPLADDELLIAGAKSGRLVTFQCGSDFLGDATATLSFDAVRVGCDDVVRKSLPLTAQRQARLSLSHDLLNKLGLLEIGYVPLGAGREIVLSLEARGKNRVLELARVEATPSFLQAQLEPGVNVQTSGLHLLHFEIPPDAEEGSYAGITEGKVTLHFSDPEYPPLTFRPTFYVTRD